MALKKRQFFGQTSPRNGENKAKIGALAAEGVKTFISLLYHSNEGSVSNSPLYTCHTCAHVDIREGGKIIQNLILRKSSRGCVQIISRNFLFSKSSRGMQIVSRNLLFNKSSRVCVQIISRNFLFSKSSRGMQIVSRNLLFNKSSRECISCQFSAPGNFSFLFFFSEGSREDPSVNNYDYRL